MYYTATRTSACTVRVRAWFYSGCTDLYDITAYFGYITNIALKIYTRYDESKVQIQCFVCRYRRIRAVFEVKACTGNKIHEITTSASRHRPFPVICPYKGGGCFRPRL